MSQAISWRRCAAEASPLLRRHVWQQHGAASGMQLWNRRGQQVTVLGRCSAPAHWEVCNDQSRPDLLPHKHGYGHPCACCAGRSIDLTTANRSRWDAAGTASGERAMHACLCLPWLSTEKEVTDRMLLHACRLCSVLCADPSCRPLQALSRPHRSGLLALASRSRSRSRCCSNSRHRRHSSHRRRLNNSRPALVF